MLLKANIDHYSLHSLRHTNITLPIAAGVPIIPLRREWNASAQVSTIRDIYTYALRRMDRMAADKLVYFQAMKKVRKDRKHARKGTISDADEQDIIAEFKHVKAEMQRLSFETLEKYAEDLDFLEMKRTKKRP